MRWYRLQMRTLVLPRSIKPISLLTKTAVMNLPSIWTTGSKMAQIRTKTFLRPIWIDFEIIRNFYDHLTRPESKWHSGFYSWSNKDDISNNVRIHLGIGENQDFRWSEKYWQARFSLVLLQFCHNDTFASHIDIMSVSLGATQTRVWNMCVAFLFWS